MAPPPRRTAPKPAVDPYANAPLGVPSDPFYGNQGYGDSAGSMEFPFAAGFLQMAGENLKSKVTIPYALTKDGVASLRAGRPVGVYQDLLEAAKRISANPSAVPGQVMNALKADFAKAGSSPEEAGKFVGANVDPTNMFRKGGPLMAGIFAGERSATWDPAKAAERARLEAQGGLSDEEMWRQTQTWRGPDTFLRQEIDDSAAVFTPPPLGRSTSYVGKVGDVLDHPELYAAYPWMKNLTIKFDPNLRSLGSADPRSGTIEIRSDLLNNPEAVKSTILHELQHGVQAYEHFAPGGSPGFSKRLAGQAVARDVMPVHPQQAQFDSLQQQLRQKHAELNGANWTTRPIDQLNAYGSGGRLIKPADFLDSLSGQPMQYWKNHGDEIMKKTGRPPNAAKYPQAYSEWAKKTGQELVAVIKQKGPKVDSSKIQAEINLLGSQLNQLRNSSEFKRNNQKYLDYMDRQNVAGKTTFEAYQALGGEAESRAIQARMNFLLSQRQNTYPGASYDIRPGLTYNALYTDLFNVPPGTIPTSARP